MCGRLPSFMGKGQLEAGISDCKLSGPRPPASAPSSVDCGGSGSGAPLHPWASLVAQLVRLRLLCSRPWSDSWVGNTRWRRDKPPTPVSLGLTCGSAGQESSAMQETPARSLGWADPLRRNRLPTPVFWPGEFTDCMGSQRVGHE